MERDGFFSNTTILFFVAVIGLAFYWTNHSWSTDANVLKMPVSENYEMGRAKSALSDYDISNRKVVETTTYEEGSPAAIAAATAKGKPLANAAAVKAATPAASASEAAKKVEVAKKIAEQKKRAAQLGVRVVGGQTQTMSGFDDMIVDSDPQVQQIRYQQPQAKPDVANADDVNDRPKLTAAQWRQVLFADPSANSVRNFVTAFHEGDVKIEDFYQISESLLNESAPDRQAGGLLAFSLDPSVKSFSILAKFYQAAGTSNEMKNKTYAVLKTYGDASKLSLLSRAFASTEAPTLIVAAKVLAQSIAAQKPTTQTGPDRTPGRTPVSVTVIPAAQFQAFLPALNRMLTSQEAGLAQQAQALIDSINSLSKA